MCVCGWVGGCVRACVRAFVRACVCVGVLEPQLHADFWGIKYKGFLAGFQKLQVMNNGMCFR